VQRPLEREGVRSAAVRPIRASGRGFWMLFGLFAALTVWGLVAWAYQIVRGLGVAGYDDRTFWSVYEANLVTFIGVSYGGAVVSAILRLTRTPWRAPISRLAEATALASLLVGMLFAVIHLGRPERLWELVVHPQMTSPVFWDFAAVSTYLAATVVFLYLPLIPDLEAARAELDLPDHSRLGRLYRFLARGWRGLPEQRRVLEGALSVMAVLIIPLAVSVHSVLAWAFSLTSRPGWHSTLFAPYFVVAALYSGVALVILVAAAFRRGYRLDGYITESHLVHLAFLMLVLDAAYLYMTFAELLTEGYVMEQSTTALLAELLAGRYAVAFWLWAVAGGIVPMLLVALPATRHTGGVVLAAALALAGMWLKRMLIVIPGAAQPLIAGTWGTYRMTWVSASITLAAAATIALLLLAFFRFFPVLAIAEVEELAPAADRVGTELPGIPVEGGTGR
jgi:Ni/Fe-hydrogenase subunit HybB-like protein